MGIPRYLRPPKRDRLPNTPDPFKMPPDDERDEEEDKPTRRIDELDDPDLDTHADSCHG